MYSSYTYSFNSSPCVKAGRALTDKTSKQEIHVCKKREGGGLRETLSTLHRALDSHPSKQRSERGSVESVLSVMMRVCRKRNAAALLAGTGRE